MTYIVTTDYELNKIAAPNLPLATAEYSPLYQDQLNNVLRLYFNRLDNLLGQLTAQTNSTFIQLPFGAFHQDGTSTLTTGISNVSTAPIQVASTAAFLATSGTILIEDELIGYTGKTSTSFTGITRGIYGTTNVAHTAGVVVAEAQGVASASTALALPLNTTDVSHSVRIDATDPSKIIFDKAGWYNLQFSAQMLNFTTSDDNVSFWYRKNGVDIPFSAGVTQIGSKHGASPGSLIAGWNFVLDMQVNDYVQLYCSSISGNTVCATQKGGTAVINPPVTPVSPALILTATFVSGLY